MAKDAASDKPAKGDKGTEETKAKDDAKAPKVPRPPTALEVLFKNLQRLNRAVTTKDPRQLMRALRYTAAVRRNLPVDSIVRVVQRFVTDKEDRTAILDVLADVKAAAAASDTSGDTDMGAGAGAGAGAAAGSGAAAPSAPKVSASGTIASSDALDPPEAEAPALQAVCAQEVAAYLRLLAVALLVLYRVWDKAAVAARAMCFRLHALNKRFLDPFGAKAWGYYSLAKEATGSLASIRPDLLRAHRTACLRHDEYGQATLLNLILRNFLHYKLFDQAQKLVAKTTFPASISNNQFVRYLYYQGRIHAVQLEYAEAYDCLVQAERKAPSNTALAFRVSAQKLAIIVQLLMGDTPERSLFDQQHLKVPLAPYFAITQAVRVGDLAAFNACLTEHAALLKHDHTFNLATRLKQNVIKTGLRKIATSYSRIHFADIAAKLQLESAEDAEFLCAKAIRDGVVDAVLDHSDSSLVSKEVVDVYSTLDPQQAFHKRITFCLDVHNEAVKGMRYPSDAYRQKHEESSLLLEAELMSPEELDGLADDDEEEGF